VVRKEMAGRTTHIIMIQAKAEMVAVLKAATAAQTRIITTQAKVDADMGIHKVVLQDKAVRLKPSRPILQLIHPRIRRQIRHRS